MSIELQKNFDPNKFNDYFEEQREKLKRLNDEEDKRELEKLNKEVRKKKISELSFNEYMIDWKITLLNLLNNILHLNINKDTFTQDNTLYHLGFTILFFVIIYYMIYSFYCINKQEDNRNKYFIYIKK